MEEIGPNVFQTALENVKKLIEQGGLWPSGKFDRLVTVEGVPFPVPFITEDKINTLKTLEARTDDVFIISYPKAGTTWTQEVVSAVCHDGDIDKVNQSHTLLRVPFLEETMFASTKDIKVPSMIELLNRIKSPRTIKSHLPAHLLPPDIMTKKSRIVYVARNPKDVAVSYYYFCQWIPELPNYNSWDEFFQAFYSGKVYNGAWWEHYLDFWKRRHEPNVLFLKFEDMKRDLKSIVEQVADFLGYKFTSDVIDGIVTHCTFENMKRNPQTNIHTLYQPQGEQEMSQKEETSNQFFRKGKVGDWRNHFTVAQNDAMDALIEEKLKGTGLKFD